MEWSAEHEADFNVYGDGDGFCIFHRRLKRPLTHGFDGRIIKDRGYPFHHFGLGHVSGAADHGAKKHAALLAGAPHLIRVPDLRGELLWAATCCP